MAAIDQSKIYKKYKGKWIALKENRKTVISSGKTLAEVLERAREKGVKYPILTRIPKQIIPYIGFFEI